MSWDSSTPMLTEWDAAAGGNLWWEKVERTLLHPEAPDDGVPFPAEVYLQWHKAQDSI